MDSNIRDGRDELFLLGVASLMGRLEVVRVLLMHGAVVNDASPRGYTALHDAALFGRAGLLADVIDLLLSDGAGIHAPTPTEFMPLLLSSYGRDAGHPPPARSGEGRGGQHRPLSPLHGGRCRQPRRNGRPSNRRRVRYPTQRQLHKKSA